MVRYGYSRWVTYKVVENLMIFGSLASDEALGVFHVGVVVQ
jgi:hypothetical protein